MNLEAALAAHRFGLGAGKRDLEAMRGDARGWLKSQLSSVDPLMTAFAGQKSTGQVLRELPGMREAATPSAPGTLTLNSTSRDRYLELISSRLKS